MRRLKNTFGIAFLLLVVSVYWTQGFRSLAWMAVSYQMKDQLKLTPAASQFVTSIVYLPWSIKPLYGIFSDCVPIFGGRRIPYMIISSVLCFVPWLLLGTVEELRSSSFYLMILLTIQNLGGAMADVVVDAMVAEGARQERAEFAGDLQSLSWFAMAFGGILGSITGGYALEKLNVHGIFILFAIFPVVQLFSCIFVDDKGLSQQNRDPETQSDDLDIKHLEDLTEEFSTAENGTVKPSEPEVSAEDEDWIRVESSGVSEEVESKGPVRRRKMEAEVIQAVPPDEEKSHDTRLGTTIKRACISLFQAVKQPSIFRPMLWFLLSQAVIPNLTGIMFYYQTNFLKLDASFLGTSRVVGWGGLMMGTYVYHRYLKRASLRKMFSYVHIVVAILTLTDILLVSRMNVWLGIPDKAFVLGASAIGDAVMQFKFMPFLVFSGKICPPGIEGTLFALFMSINNLGGTISQLVGGALASALGISGDEFGNLSLGIFIQAMCTLIPVLLIFLIPANV